MACPEGNDVVSLSAALVSRIRHPPAGEFNKLVADFQIVSQSSKTNAFGGVVHVLIVNSHEGAHSLTVLRRSGGGVRRSVVGPRTHQKASPRPKHQAGVARGSHFRGQARQRAR